MVLKYLVVDVGGRRSRCVRTVLGRAVRVDAAVAAADGGDDPWVQACTPGDNVLVVEVSGLSGCGGTSGSLPV
jgi:hypothetical protein